MTPHTSDKIIQAWGVLDSQRGKYPSQDVGHRLEALAASGITLTADEFSEVFSDFRGNGPEGYFPRHVADFIAKVLAKNKPGSILDPWAGMGLLAIRLAQQLMPTRYDAFNQNSNLTDSARLLEGADAISWHAAAPLSALPSWPDTYDAVVSSPPFGYAPTNIQIEASGKTETVQDDTGHLIILQSCQRLSEQGVGVFVVIPKFVTDTREHNARSALSKLGFHVTDYIELPAGTFDPVTSVVTAIVVIRRTTVQRIFVGGYSIESGHQETLLSNMLQRRAGQRISQGSLVEPQGFRGVAPLETAELAATLSKRMGLRAISLREAVSAINNPAKGNEFSRFEDVPHAVYLPQMAKTPATTVQDDLPDALKSYLQLIINPAVADAEYLAGMLNTPLGFAIRDSARSGTTIPRIASENLMNATLYLPPLATQRECVRANRDLEQLRSGLSELQTQVWQKPSEIAKTLKAITAINREERFQDWLDSLPFPLASILWTYHARAGDNKSRYEVLLHFFEAFAEFHALVLLSAFASDAVLFAEIRRDLGEALSEQSMSFDRASFGTWKCVVEMLSKRGRTLLTEKAARCTVLFRTSNTETIAAITDRKLIGVLVDANGVRNDHAHGGIVSPSVGAERHAKLQRLLGTVRESIGTSWSNYELLLPDTCRLHKGIWHYKVNRIMGSRTPFPSGEIELAEPMEDGNLYLWGNGERQALKLLPLVKILPSPQSQPNACYFYNRRQKGKIKFLSYYFESPPQIEEAFADASAVLDSLRYEKPSRSNGAAESRTGGE